MLPITMLISVPAALPMVVPQVSVLDKSKMDWKDFKSSDATLEEELELYKKSGDKYLDKVIVHN